MSRFRFRLESVLGVRTKFEQIQQKLVAQADLAVRAAEEHRNALWGQHDETSALIRERHKELDVIELQGAYARLEFLAKEIIRAGDLVVAAQAALAQARTRLIAASKDRKVLETLKERRKVAHQTGELQAEHRSLDDANSRREARFGAN